MTGPQQFAIVISRWWIPFSYSNVAGLGPSASEIVLVPEDEGYREIRVAIPPLIATLLLKARHPSYTRFIGPLLEHARDEFLGVQLGKGPDGRLSAWLIDAYGQSVPELLTLALTIAEKLALPIYLDPSLLICSDGFSAESDLDQFRAWLEEVTADDFAGFDQPAA